MRHGEPNRHDVLPTTSRYEILLKIAAGGMATVYVGRSRARGGITRLFAVKRAHPHLLDDPVFRSMFVAEARLASRIHHPNVVAVQDVEELDDELLLVMDYVEGAALADLRKNLIGTPARTRVRLATRVAIDACAGLHAAHELRDDDGTRLEIVHRDVSPHNVLVGVDGIGRLADFGIAKSTAHTGRSTVTGGLKGKLGYMAPEYVETGSVDRRADVFGFGVVLWETLTGERLFHASTEIETMRLVIQCAVAPPSTIAPGIPRALDAVVLRALARSPSERFPTARALSDALEHAAREADLLGTHDEVGALVEQCAGSSLATRRETIRRSLDEDADSAVAEETLEPLAHSRTHTLGPTEVPTAAHAPTLRWHPSGEAPHASSSATPPALTPSSSAASSPGRSRALAGTSLLLIAATVVVGSWAGVRRLSREPGKASPSAPAAAVSDAATTPLLQTPPLAPVVEAAPAAPVAPALAVETATSAPSAALEAEASDAGAPPVTASAAARPAGTGPRGTRPRPVPRGTTATSAPASPDHAPPNPYRRDAARP